MVPPCALAILQTMFLEIDRIKLSNKMDKFAFYNKLSQSVLPHFDPRRSLFQYTGCPQNFVIIIDRNNRINEQNSSTACNTPTFSKK